MHVIEDAERDRTLKIVREFVHVNKTREEVLAAEDPVLVASTNCTMIQCSRDPPSARLGYDLMRRQTCRAEIPKQSPPGKDAGSLVRRHSRKKASRRDRTIGSSGPGPHRSTRELPRMPTRAEVKT